MKVYNMGFLDKIFNRKSEAPEENRSELSQQFSGSNPIYGTLNFATMDTYTQSKSLKLAAVYRCVNIISDSIAVMEINNFLKKGNWQQKQHNRLYELLNIAPNAFMSAFIFKKNMVQNILMSGNAFILIKRDKVGEPSELILLDPSTVQVISINADIKYNVISSSYYNLPVVESRVYDKSEIIHVMNFSINNFVGISTISYANMVLGTAYSSEVQANNFFTSNNVLTGILKPSAGNHLTKDKADSAKQAFMNNLNAGINSGSNSVIVLDSGLDYQAIQSNPKDSMLLENREFSGLQICQFFGCPPDKVFLTKAQKAATNEASQIEFLNSTLLPLIEKIEAELYRKLVLPVDYATVDIKADATKLLRLDAKAQADVNKAYFEMGALTTNEIRASIDADYPVTGGNSAFISTNLQKLDNPVVQGKQSTSGTTAQQNFVDNKLK